MALPRLEPDELYPAFAWPGGYPIVYYTEDGGLLCPACANRENGSEATADLPNREDPQWHLVDYDTHMEGPPETCDHCGAQIESAYGDPEEEAAKEQFAADVAAARKLLDSGNFDLSDETDRDVAADWLKEQGVADEVVEAVMEEIKEKMVRTSEFKMEIVHDDTPDISWLEGRADNEEDAAADRERLESYGETWHMVGVIVTVDTQDGMRHESPGLWGIESDSGKEYFQEVFADESVNFARQLEEEGYYVVNDGVSV